MFTNDSEATPVAEGKVVCSIIIPVWNEAVCIEKTLGVLQRAIGNRAVELLAVDGGSTDGTPDLVALFPEVLLLHSPRRGRALQMNYGAARANGQILLFLHADTLMSRTAFKCFWSYINKKRPPMAGAFRMQFDVPGWCYELLGWATHWNSTWTTYGDQGLFVDRDTFFAVGGFPDQPLLEDVAIQHELRRRTSFVKLPASVITSARRFQRRGRTRQLIRNGIILLAYRLGVSPQRLAAWYAGK